MGHFWYDLTDVIIWPTTTFQKKGATESLFVAQRSPVSTVAGEFMITLCTDSTTALCSRCDTWNQGGLHKKVGTLCVQRRQSSWSRLLVKTIGYFICLLSFLTVLLFDQNAITC